ncbi:pyridoxine 5'-phosphate synthase [Geothermobacter hydrogeniphilus]|uniref:Pyridoxine 5'-phosphate synthase n=1 Tax=Geothermobacter hydrogeniphilus TaxID=1969733 RepID=A0A1X0YCX0_9BACT|nr:pyridoxine 5'-phosphate synthase [Geothermobacter hydrogeniphilus]ORJ63045.1 pyridoxine 5'-phosphate synthase [Geothermobacter hydrogeniphilus]PNU21566.1 pyridoxine 5'-phosphate synthase [Geothermobacter hydrogeniphilus]
MAKLGVNVDHVATVRQARGVSEPDPVIAASLAELAGAHGITVHLREDRRHIQDRDVRLLRQTVQSRLNLEMAATDEMVGIALDILPDSATLVPEKREELTTEGGLDVCLHRNLIKKQTGLLRQAGISVSLFIDPDIEQVKAAHRAGADFIEIHTGSYCEARTDQLRRQELEKIETALRAGRKLGLGVNAGHGLNYQNVDKVAALSGFHEFNIGHSIISRAVLVGMERAVREMLALIS